MKNEIYIGITGNRDISEEQIVFIKERIEEFLSNCQKDNEFVELIVLTPLADGVDRIIANSILENFLNIKILVPLPFSEFIYKNTFGKGLKVNKISEFESIKEYESLIYKIKKHNKSDVIFINLDFYEEIYLNQNAEEQSKIRNKQYALLGEYLIEKSDILIAVYDKNREIKKGGTIEIVNKFNLKTSMNKKLFEINI